MGTLFSGNFVKYQVLFAWRASNSVFMTAIHSGYLQASLKFLGLVWDEIAIVKRKCVLDNNL